MPPIIFVLLGGAIGAGFRYQIGTAAMRNLGSHFPWGTWIINLLGGLLMGILAGTLAKQFTPEQGEPLRLLLGVGVLGGFTTFSSFSLEAVMMLERRAYGTFAAYVAGSVVLSILALMLGLLLLRKVVP